MAKRREWTQDTSSRGCDFTYCKGKHVNLTGLKEDHPNHDYLGKENIPNYPKYLFSVSKVSHVTDKNGLHRIFEDGGFRRGDDNFLWWDLDCISAGIKFRNSNELSWQSPNQMHFQQKFTSPAFQKTSRYGNFRFTLNLRELLNIYSKKFCDRTAPILRVMDTRLYKKEIQYSVLVNPRYMTHYKKKNPRLPVNINNFLCGYSQGKMFWHCQSPSDSYEYSLEVDNEAGEVYDRQLEKSEYYVWDHVAVAFHMKRDWVLPVDYSRLFECLSVCEMASEKPEMSVDEAEAEVKKLKSKYL